MRDHGPELYVYIYIYISKNRIGTDAIVLNSKLYDYLSLNSYLSIHS